MLWLLGDITNKLRPLGIRGAIELCETYEHATSSNVETADSAEKALAAAAAQLSQPVDTVKNLAHTLLWDGQVDLVWTFWETSFDKRLPPRGGSGTLPIAGASAKDGKPPDLHVVTPDGGE